jgi:hypothetical protein
MLWHRRPLVEGFRFEGCCRPKELFLVFCPTKSANEAFWAAAAYVQPAISAHRELQASLGENLYWICTGFPFLYPRKYRENWQFPKWFCKVLQGTLRCLFNGFSREKR